MLILVFKISGNRYSIRTIEIIEVIPLVNLLKVPNSPGHFPGVLNYRGKVVPAIDLGVLLGNGPHHCKMSTRIALVPYPATAGDLVIGLILDDIEGVRRINDNKLGGIDLISDQESTDQASSESLITRFQPARMIPAATINEMLRLYLEENSVTDGPC